MSLEKTNELVGVLLKARTVAHVEHWATDSFSVHMALQGFYEGISDLMDRFVEAYQGYYDARVSPPIEGGKPAGRPVDALERDLEAIERLRYQAVPEDETCLQNIIDEIEGLYQTTIYKLKFLK